VIALNHEILLIMPKRRAFSKSGSNRRPPMTTKRVEQIAKRVDRHTEDKARFSRVKAVVQPSSIIRFPKSNVTVRMFGLQAMGWDASQQPPNATISVGTVIKNFKDYVPRYLKINSVTIYTPRTITGGRVGPDDTNAYGQLAQLAFNIYGNYVGLPLGFVEGAFDTIRSGILQLVSGNREKFTYYPSHRDQSIVWDVKAVEGHDGDTNNPTIFDLAIVPSGYKTADPSNIPVEQAEDVYCDVALTRWGYERALTFKELMISDPEFRLEQAKKIKSLPSRLDTVQVTTLESATQFMSLIEEDATVDREIVEKDLNSS